MYAVKEIFYTLQGEGANAGRAAVFCRFAGCNLWSGREAHRADAICQFCDTDFVGTDGPGGGHFADAELLGGPAGAGREAHRAEAICQFCDTDFVGTDGPGGGHFADAESLAAHVDTVAG